MWAVQVVNKTSVGWHFSHLCEGDVEVWVIFSGHFHDRSSVQLAQFTLCLQSHLEVSGLCSKGVSWGVFTWQSLIHPSAYYFVQNGLKITHERLRHFTWPFTWKSCIPECGFCTRMYLWLVLIFLHRSDGLSNSFQNFRITVNLHPS